MFSIYQSTSRGTVKEGYVIRQGDIDFLVISILGKGYFHLDRSESYLLRVKKLGKMK